MLQFLEGCDFYLFSSHAAWIALRTLTQLAATESEFIFVRKYVRYFLLLLNPLSFAFQSCKRCVDSFIFCMISCVILSALVEQRQALFRVFSNIERLLLQTNRPRGLLHSLQSLFDLLETLTDVQIRPQQPLLHEAASAGATPMASGTAQLVLRPHELQQLLDWIPHASPASLPPQLSSHPRVLIDNALTVRHSLLFKLLTCR